MNKKRLLGFAIATNIVFYFFLAAALYWYQKRALGDELTQGDKRIAALLDTEMTAKRNFYHEWFTENVKLLESKPAREILQPFFHIDYLGKIVDRQLVSIGNYNIPPPFSIDALEYNPRYLFFRDKKNLFFTYTMQLPGKQQLVVVQKDDKAFFSERAREAGASIVVVEGRKGERPTALYSNLKAKETQDLLSQYEFHWEYRIMSLDYETFFIFPHRLHGDGSYQQSIIYAFKIESYSLAPSLGMAVILLALFCSSTFLLYYSYQKSIAKA